MTTCALDLYWIPVGAGTSRFQRGSLRLWEAVEAARSRRPRAVLLHAALKLTLGETTSTLELTPAFVGGDVPPLGSGPVGLRAAGRLRLFRYQLRLLPIAELPDEAWAVASPIRLSEDCPTVQRVIDLAPSVPTHTWGRRLPGTGEMWTSDSVVSWLLVRAGLDPSRIDPPAGSRAPGWSAGIALAR